MIGIKEINELMLQKQEKNKEFRFKSLHLSELAICGFKYRNSIENKLPIKFRWIYEIGNVFEWKLVQQLKELDDSIIASPKQFTVKYNMNGQEVIGHLDAYSMKNDTAYEIKASKSDNYIDVYERQLFAYMLSGNIHYGKLIKYNITYDKMSDFTYQLPLIENKTKKLMEKQTQAFLNNEYIDGIDNSLCQFCENVNCKLRLMK